MSGRIFLIAIPVLAIVAGAIFLAGHMVPVHMHAIEKVISNERFFK